MDKSINKDSFSTLLMVMKHDYGVNRKSILLTLGVIYGFCLVIGGVIGYNYRGGGNGQASVLLFILSVMGWSVSSFAFSDMKSKEGRISSLMLPAEIWQKFLVRWVAMVIGLFLMLIVGFYLTEFSRILINIITYGYVGPDNPYYHVINPFAISLTEGLFLDDLLPTMGLSYFLSQSLFFFGSILWPKLSFIKTLAVLWGIEALLGLIFIVIFKNVTVSFNLNLCSGWIVACQIIFIIIIYILSYLRFKRSQVVYRLF